MAAIGPGWVDGAWVAASWVPGAWGAVAPPAAPAALPDSAGSGLYPGIDVLQQWLNTYFKPAYLKTPEEKREESTVNAFDVVEITPELVGELARLDGIQALFEKALELDQRESTARVARKKRQIARERDELRLEIEIYVKKLRRRRRDNEAIETILEYV